MPIEVIDEIIPKNGLLFPVATARNLRGVAQVFADVADRDAFDPRKLVIGMDSKTLSPAKRWELTTITPLVWTEVVSGGGGGGGGGITTLTGDVTASGTGTVAATIASLAVTDAKVATANKDGTAITPSMRTLGPGALQAAAGNDARFSDSRAPTSHAASHATGGSDPLTPAAIGAATPASVTASVAAHIAAVDPHADRAFATAEVTAHVALADPHAQYQREVERNAINGYAGLDAAALLPAAVLPALTGAVTTAAGSTSTALAANAVGTVNIASLAVTDAKVATANKDGAAITPSMRTLGTGSLQAAAGDDARLVSAVAASARLGTETIATDSFSVNISTQISKLRLAIGAVTITDITGLAAGLNAVVVIRNTTASPISVTVVPALDWYTPATVSVPVGGSATLSLLSTTATLAGVVAGLRGDDAVVPADTQSRVARGYSVWYQPRPQTTVIVVTGNSAGTMVTSGTAASRIQTTASYFGALARVGYVGATTAGAAAGWAHGGDAAWHRGAVPRAGGFLMTAIFAVSDATLVGAARLRVGIGGPANFTDVNPGSTANSIEVGADTGDTTLSVFHRGAAAVTKVSLGALFPCNTVSSDVYEVQISARPGGGTISVRVERLNTGDVAVVSPTTNLPDVTTLMLPTIIRSNGGAASAVGLDIAMLALEPCPL